jgi:hypothetical protein
MPNDAAGTGRLQLAALYLFAAFLGVALGAGLYEGRIVVPQWIVATDEGYVWDAAAATQADTGRRFWVYVTTVPLTLLTVASLVLAFRYRGPGRHWWRAAAGASLADRVFTFAYFIPTLLRLMSGELPQPRAVELGLQWQNLDVVRDLLSGVAFLSALAALALVRVEVRSGRRAAAART